jgi:hypothetical protein
MVWQAGRAMHAVDFSHLCRDRCPDKRGYDGWITFATALICLVIAEMCVRPRGCYEPVGSAGRVKPAGGFVFHLDRSSPLPLRILPGTDLLRIPYARLSLTRNGGRRTSAIPPFKLTHDWHLVHNSV